MKYFILVNDGGIITSVDPASGKLPQEGRSRDAIGEYYASPVAADNKVFLANVDGKMTVLQAGAQWEVLGVNDLAEETHATPALSNGRIYVRTRGPRNCGHSLAAWAVRVYGARAAEPGA